MFNLGGMRQVFTRAVGVGTLLLKRHAPEICTYSGIVIGAVATGLACKQTLVFVGVLEEAKDKVTTIHELRDSQAGVVTDPTYSEDDARKDLVTVYAQTAVQTVKVYALPVGLGLLSVGLILGGHRILRRENAAVTAAYVALTESFKQYRKRVEADVGADKEKEYFLGTKSEAILVQDEDGTTSEKIQTLLDTNGISIYARFFNTGNPNWRPNPELNLMFLRSNQNYANDILHAKGHIFLNEVYDMLGIPRTEAGQLVGWVDGEGDSFVDFGVYKPSVKNANFLEGYDDTVLLDFNVDGVILDLFEKKVMKIDKKRRHYK